MPYCAPSGKQPALTLSRLPPLTALRAFTAAARHLSFVRASEELHVTPAAIGQHVRQLESHFGQLLFLRNRGQLELTDTGRTLFPGLEQAFEAVLSSVSRLGEDKERGELRISAPSSFISKWFVPRLNDLRQVVPDIRIVLQREDDAAIAEARPVDCAIRIARDGAAGQEADYLFQDELVPVCSPSYQLRYGLESADLGLDRITLLDEVRHDHDSLYPGWERWLRDQCPSWQGEVKRISVADASTVIDAALAGQGVGLVSLRLVQQSLSAGRLVIPFGSATPIRDAYFFVAYGPVAPASPVAALRQWLVSEAAHARGHVGNATMPDRPLMLAAE